MQTVSESILDYNLKPNQMKTMQFTKSVRTSERGRARPCAEMAVGELRESSLESMMSEEYKAQGCSQYTADNSHHKERRQEKSHSMLGRPRS